MYSVKKKEELLKNIQDGFERFFKENGHYPSTPEMNRAGYFPSIKQIERVLGGIKKTRELLGMEIIDHTKGATRGEKCIAINKRGQVKNLEVYRILCKKFGEAFVHKEHTPLDDCRVRVDFYVYSPAGNFFVDVFYPTDMQSMGGCLNNKTKKYIGGAMNQFPVIFLMTNKDIEKERIASFLAARKNKFGKNQSFMDLDQFNDYINKKTVFTKI
jgi:hypothetical protein